MAGMAGYQLGIIGSGLMGSGIAQVAAHSGCEVTLVDLDEPRVERAIAGIRARLDREAERGRITPEAAADAGARLHAAGDLESLGSIRTADAVIEA